MRGKMDANTNNYFGIDFGTTSSATVGYMVADGKLQRFFYGDDEGRPIPSVVAIDKKTGEVYTGRAARNRRMELSESCEYIPSVKTIIDEDKSIEVAGKEWTPVDIAAAMFEALKKSVKEQTKSDMSRAVVAIPVGFSPKKREKLREAADKAGVHISSFISEPTAAFYANYGDLKSSSVVAVFDWGGGTLDVSIIKNEGGSISELATNGLDIAGDYIDEKIAHRVHSKIARKKRIEVSFEDMPSSDRDNMLVRAELAKRNLADDDTATISLNSYGKLGTCRETLDYDWFADIIEPEVDKAIECLKKTIDQSGVGLANIDRILLVGGSSNLRPLLDKLDKVYGDKLYFPEETMWNVSLGAARLAMTPGGYYTNQQIGLVMSDGSFFQILKKDVPLSKCYIKCDFGMVDDTSEARLVFSGSPDIDNSLEKYRTLEVPSYGFLQEKIKIEAFVDENMVFNVKAGSTMRPSEFSRIWEYPYLKCYYKLPEEKTKK